MGARVVDGMLPVRMKLQLVAFVLLSAGVGANILMQQQRAHAVARKSPPAASEIAAGAARTRIDTGSIGRPGGTGIEALLAAEPGAKSLEEAAGDRVRVTRAVQRELRIRGYEPGAVDGADSLITQAAIMGFEHDHGLALTGRASEELLKRIILGAESGGGKDAGKRGQSAEAEAVIRSVQTQLARLGYKPGRIDGRLSPDTVRAIREFEVDQALPESGRVSGPLVSRLARLTGDDQLAARP